MTRRWLGRLGLLVLLACLGPALPAEASGTGTPGYCTDAVGVTVVVDFQQLGGGVVVRCFPHPTSSSTGLQALEGAGFVPTGTLHDGLSFICRIDGEPTKTDESCISTPPATAYWGYWYATNGGTWKYSSLGVASHRVIPGGFEGWSFSKDRTAATSPPPRVAPSHGVAAPPPPPTPAPSKVSAKSTPTGHAAVTATAPPPSPSGGVAPPTPTAPDASTSSNPTTGAAVQAGGSAPPVSFDVVAAASSGGSPWASVVGVALALAALGGAGAVAVRRRNIRLADGG